MVQNFSLLKLDPDTFQDVDIDTLTCHLYKNNYSFAPSSNDRFTPSEIYTQQTFIAGLYGILFLVGLCGNSCVLSIVLFIKTVLKRHCVKDKECTFIFIIALCLVDSIVILSMPMTISDLLLDHWLFGVFTCKFYWLMDSTGKVMSTFILAAWSFERFMAVCHPTKKRFRKPKSTLTVVGFLAILALLLLIPLPYSADVLARPMPSPEMAVFGIAFYTQKCTTSFMSDRLFLAFTIYVFLLCYCLPFALMSYFYLKVLARIRWQKRALHQSKIPLKRITIYTVALIGFYFFCYTPYWIGTLLSIFDDFVSTETAVYVMYGIHALPYVNSTFNFIFYALLNTQLRNKTQDVRSSLTGFSYSVHHVLAEHSRIVVRTSTPVRSSPSTELRRQIVHQKGPRLKLKVPKEYISEMERISVYSRKRKRRHTNQASIEEEATTL